MSTNLHLYRRMKSAYRAMVGQDRQDDADAMCNRWHMWYWQHD